MTIDESREHFSNVALPLPNETLHLGGRTPILAVWGGLGFTKRPIKDLRDLYSLHQDDLSDFLQHCSRTLRSIALAESDGTKDSVEQDLLGWIIEPSRRLATAPEISAAVNGAVTTVLQMSRYVLMCKRLGMTPGELARSFTAFAGHSLGMSIAVCMAAADSWSSLNHLADNVIMSAYYAGRQASVVWDQGTSIPKSTVTEFVRRGEGTPSCMLSITGLERGKVLEMIDAVNPSLPYERKLHMALINDVDSFVVAGDLAGLVALCGRLRMFVPVASVPDESRIIFNQRPARCSLQFVAATVPYHTPHLQKACDGIVEKMKHFVLRKDEILVPVWGLDALLEEKPTLAANMGPGLTEISLSRMVDWPKILEGMSGPWQVLDFGPGGDNGIGMVINKMKAGSGSKVYVVCPADNYARRSRNSVPDLLSTLSIEPNLSRYPRAQFAAHREGGTERQARVTTTFRDVMALPPLLVAGMTPTTCDVELVAAIMNAGFYVEFATGGYHDVPSLTAALRTLAQAIPSDRLITVNVIYANPQGLSWIIPQLAALVREGLPIGGLTIGAGIPSPQVALEYITTLELSYIGFKPASVSAIHQVLEIAKAHATLPIILQWTGGRAGGHHSFEDFHQPILEAYQAIRETKNVILVAGSGFGDAQGSWPYLSGEWSQKLGRPLMPFDAILLGTCIMTTLEAKTSRASKDAMIDACGVSDAEWPATLQGPAGGVISVISHLGEPMHVVATRGMQLWAELDKTLFNQPKEKMLKILHSRRAYYIARLNDDYQKVWFGIDYASNKPVELASMTYFDVLRRLLELLHPVRKGDWSDPSYQTIFNDFLVRIFERFDGQPESKASKLSPCEQLDAIASKLPHLARHFLSVEDTHYFVDLCGRRGQKPVPFIPVLDAEFPVRFKKDPLWQAEDLDSTYHGDAGRVCILCGPVAVKYCTDPTVSVGVFLDSINQGYREREAQLLLGTHSASDSATWPLYEENELVSAIGAPNIHLQEDCIQLGEGMPHAFDHNRWLLLVSSRLGPWGRRFFGTRKLVSNGQAYSNPIRRLFSARSGALVRFLGKHDGGYTGAEICGSAVQRFVDARVSIDGSTITATIINRCTKDGQVRELQLMFECDQSRPYAPITEMTHDRTDRIHEFYQNVLFGPTNKRRLEEKAVFMMHPPVFVSHERVLAWMAAVDGKGLDSLDPLGPAGEVAIEYATIIVWPAIWRHLFTWDWDVSKLLHMRTTIQLREGHRMLSVGDEVVMNSRLIALHNRASGLEATLHMVYSRDGKEFLDMEFTSMILGERCPESDFFKQVYPTSWTMNLRTEGDVQALLEKPWFQAVTESESFRVGQTLEFELRRETSPHDGSFQAKTSGQVWVQNPKLPSDEKLLCARVEQIVNINHPDLVTGFMMREAMRTGMPVTLPTERALKPISGSAFKIITPDNTIEYADVGGDYNPIHTINTFARFSGFQVPVYHGNHTVALVLQLIRREIPGATRSTLCGYECDFPAVVYPGDKLSVTIKHIAMHKGRRVLSFSVRRESSDELVLMGEITLDAPLSAFLFTGQGSQFAGMGLDMISESRPSRLVWAKADEYFENQWGISLSSIVRQNPKRLTVNFCGHQGMRIRQNYLDIQEMLSSCASTNEIKLFSSLNAESRSYTFHSEDGLLSMTQFAQPAIFVVEKAAFEHLKYLGRVAPGSNFAGHSLGEFAALGCMTSIMSMEAALKTVFIRGALMQTAVPRDSLGRSEFGMVALDPSRIGKDYEEKHIVSVVTEIAESTGLLLEMVNFNVRGHQYVCAGEKRSLEILRRVTDELQQDGSGVRTIQGIKQLVSKHTTGISISASGVTLIRGKATVPLNGIDVPFHSSLLAPMRKLFRRTLISGINKEAVDPEALVGKWIPNVTGKPFAVDDAYVKLVTRLIGSVQDLAVTG